MHTSDDSTTRLQIRAKMANEIHAAVAIDDMALHTLCWLAPYCLTVSTPYIQ